MKPIRLFAAAALLIGLLCPAFAADAVFPRGMRLGLTPLVGLSPARSFTGFETEDHGVKVIVDPKSLPYIDGTELDFAREGLNEGFRFNNPNVKDNCGCGESFRI